MPPDVHSLRVRDVTLGDRVTFQILALTDHPVGRHQDDGGRSAREGDSAVLDTGNGERRARFTNA